MNVLVSVRIDTITTLTFNARSAQPTVLDAVLLMYVRYVIQGIIYTLNPPQLFV